MLLCMMKYKKEPYLFWGLFLSLMLVVSSSWAQLLPPNQPEQDACQALQLCGNRFFTPYSYQGQGRQFDLAQTPCGIPGLAADENNSMWLKFEINTSGTVVFELIPVNPQDDYDWAIVKLDNGNCANLSINQVVRCNFNRNVPVTNNGITGLNIQSTETGVPANTQGHSYCRYLDAQAGETYLIMINNFGYQGGISSGFTIDFGGSTATFNQPPPLHLNNIENQCNTGQSVTVQLTAPFKCSSIAANGSDFRLSGPTGSIASATGVNCNGNQGYTEEVTVHFVSPLPPGTYTLKAQIGTDNNTLLDLCDNELPLPDSLSFEVPLLNTTETMEICAHQLPYTWHGQVLSQGGQNIAQTSFTTAAGCDSVVQLNLLVTDTLKATEHLTICPDQLPFHWNGQILNNGGNRIAQYYSVGVHGCDSLTTLNLTVQYPRHEQFNLEGCGSVSFNNKTYLFSQDTVLDTVISHYGCDSIFALLHIEVHPVDTQTNHHLIQGCSYVDFRGKRYGADTLLIDTFRNQYGCDSLYERYTIKVYPDEYLIHRYEVNACREVEFEGHTYYQDRVLVDTFQGVYGCDSAIRYVNLHPNQFKLALEADPDTSAVGVRVHLSTFANQSQYQVLAWLPLREFSNQTALDQYIITRQQGSVTYQVVGQSQDGCIDTASLTLKVDTLSPYVFMPNAFSPNGDGLNDVFKPYFVNKSGHTILYFRIFNRWGQLVYQANRVQNAGWEGRYPNGQAAHLGVYYYQIAIDFVDGTQIELKGDLSLIR